MRRLLPFLGPIAAVCLGFLLLTPAARASTTTVTGASASVTITGPSPATLLFPFTRVGNKAYNVWVHYKTMDGTARAGTDYLPGSGAYKLPAHAATAALPIAALGKNQPYPDRQFTLKLTSVVGVGPTPNFATQQAFGVGDRPSSVVAADVNGDGRPDLVAANDGADTVSVLLNTTVPGAASPSFAVQQTFGVGLPPPR